MVHARAKGSFIGTGVDKILIQFKYLFNTSDPGVEIVVYLSDRPWLYDPDDPLRARHCLEVARIPCMQSIVLKLPVSQIRLSTGPAQQAADASQFLKRSSA
jgi:hypothetical protein